MYTCTASTAATARCCRWPIFPNCGAVVTRTQADRAARLLSRLGAELARRQDLLAAAPASDRLPHIVVLLDRWEGFTTTLGEADGTLTDMITRILSEGASAGIHLIMTGDRSLLAGRIAALWEDKLVFKLPGTGLAPVTAGRSMPRSSGAG